jgi:ornithine cyclodeaminase
VLSELPSPIVVGSDELKTRMPYERAVRVLADAFVAADLEHQPRRTHLPLGDAELLIMPVASPLGLGVKLLTVNGGRSARRRPNIQGVFVLFSRDTLAPLAVLDGAALTALRTAAVSALATRELARLDARRLVVFGAGVQGRAHLEAMCAVRELTHVDVVDRHPELAQGMIELAHGLGLSAAVADGDAVRSADLVCACTTSATPVFDGRLLPPGCHVNAMGAYKRDRRELDGTCMQRARVVVEHRAAALAEAGDVLLAIAEGKLRPEELAELPDLLRGDGGARRDDEITVFKSVGLAFEDLAIARAAIET